MFVMVFPFSSDGEIGLDMPKYQVIHMGETRNDVFLLPIFLREPGNGPNVVTPGGQTN